MHKYRVVWEIDLEFDTPIEAAREAASIMSMMSYGPYFTIIDQDSGKSVDIDLDVTP